MRPLAVCATTDKVEQGKMTKLYGFEGLKRVEIADAGPGEIVGVAGIEDIVHRRHHHRSRAPDGAAPHPRRRADDDDGLRVNDGPFAGREGKYVTRRNIRERLLPRGATATSRSASRTPRRPTPSRCVGRGELQLAVIIETMRREGYELTVSNPEPVTKDVDGAGPRADGADGLRRAGDRRSASVTERLGPRKGRMTDMVHLGSGRDAPARSASRRAGWSASAASS